MKRASKKNKKGYLRPYVQGAWVPVEDDLLLSVAFIKLNPSAAKLLMHILRIDKMLSWKNGDSYTGCFNLTYTEAQTFGLARGTVSRAFVELEESGFIETVVQGGLKSCRKTSSLYRVVQTWRCKGGLQKLTELEKLRQCGKAA